MTFPHPSTAAKVHLIEGPVGAGKSTFATSLVERTGGVHIALDAWFVALFSPDRPAGDFLPWYVERKGRLLALIWNHARRILASGVDVVLELGLLRREERTAFCRRVRDEGHVVVVHVLDAPREVRRARVRQRNAEKGPTFSMVVPNPVFELASDMWEVPDEAERQEPGVDYVNETSGEFDG